MDSPETPAPRKMSAEIIGIVEMTVSALNDVISSLRSEIKALGESERNARKRLYILLACVVVISGIGVIGIGANRTQTNQIKKVVNYISDCQNPAGECKKRGDTAIAKAVNQIGKLVFDSSTCIQRVPLNERTDEKIASCRKQYFGE
jgi:hypothetical protein